MKLIIAGGRDFNDYELLSDEMICYCHTNLEIVSGGAKGADNLGEIYSKVFKMPLTIFPANWKEHGKSAGYLRNNEMALYADSLLAFWDGKSRGTKHMIDLAKKHNLDVKVVLYDS